MVKWLGIEVPVEPEGIRTLCIPRLEQHATALGYFCIVFGSLESALDHWAELFLGTTEKQSRVLVNAAGQLSARCTMLKGLLYSSPMPASDWIDHAEAFLDLLTGHLVPLRNRLVHDPWIGMTTVQRERHAKIGRTQAFQPKVLLDATNHPRAIEDLWEAVDLAGEFTGYATVYAIEYEDWRQTKGQSASIPPPLAQWRKRLSALRPNGTGAS